MCNTQPNFSALFSQTFEGAQGPARYRIRHDGNLLHDLAFISSLTHDACVLSRDVGPENGSITIPLNRDCWELGYTKHEQSLELHIVDSVLQLTGVQSVQWKSEKRITGDPWLDCVWIDLRFRHESKFDFYLIGEHWKCTITLAGDDWMIQLTDSKMPYLWSSRNER